MAAQNATEYDYDKAIELEKEGMEMWERIDGKENENYVVSLDNLAHYNYYIIIFGVTIKKPLNWE